MFSLRSTTAIITTEVRIFQVSKNTIQFLLFQKDTLKIAKQVCAFSTKKIRFESINLDIAIAVGSGVEKEA